MKKNISISGTVLVGLFLVANFLIVNYYYGWVALPLKKEMPAIFLLNIGIGLFFWGNLFWRFKKSPSYYDMKEMAMITITGINKDAANDVESIVGNIGKKEFTFWVDSSVFTDKDPKPGLYVKINKKLCQVNLT